MAYNSKNILKSKEFWIGFLVAVIVFVGLTEIQKSNNRSAALRDLNAKWATLKDDKSKVAAITTMDVVMEQNKSLFNFSNSHANEGDGEKKPEEYGGGLFGTWVESIGGGVTTSWGWYNPDTGAWVDGR